MWNFPDNCWVRTIFEFQNQKTLCCLKWSLTKNISCDFEIIPYSHYIRKRHQSVTCKNNMMSMTLFRCLTVALAVQFWFLLDHWLSNLWLAVLSSCGICLPLYHVFWWFVSRWYLLAHYAIFHFIYEKRI